MNTRYLCLYKLTPGGMICMSPPPYILVWGYTWYYCMHCLLSCCIYTVLVYWYCHSYILLLLYILVATHIPFSAWRHMYTILPYTHDQSWFIYGCVHMLYCALLQCQSSYLLECHIQESSVSGCNCLINNNSTLPVHSWIQHNYWIFRVSI